MILPNLSIDCERPPTERKIKHLSCQVGNNFDDRFGKKLYGGHIIIDCMAGT